MSSQTRRPRQDEEQDPESAEERDQRSSSDSDSRPDRAHLSGDLYPKLDTVEQKEVEERSATPARVVYGAIQKEEEELERPSSALAWSGLAAGLSMGLSFVVEALIQSMLPAEHWRPLLSKLGYSVGFLLVILGQQQFLTENTLTPILPLLTRRDRATLVNVLRLWAVVLAANLVGAFLFGWVLANTSLFDAAMQRTLITVAQAPLGADFGTIFLRGVFAGWLIALMVWLLPAAETARFWVIILITYIVGLGGFAHIVAGAVEMFYLALTGAAPWGMMIVGFLLPTLLGNIVGGVALVAALNYAQVTSGAE